MGGLNAQMRLAGDGRILVKPGATASLRSVEKALRAAAVPHTIDMPGAAAVLESVDLTAGKSALAEWEISFGPGVLAAGNAFVDAALEHAAALKIRRELAANPRLARDWLAGYEGVERLDPHQMEAVALASHPDVSGLCVFDEQGLGKTVEALFAYDRLRELGVVSRALVLAPKNMVLEWLADLDRFFGAKYPGAAIVGSDSEKRAALDGGADVVATNFETASGLGIRLRQLLQAERGRAMLIVDESFFVKNAGSLRTRAVKVLRPHAGRCLVLCGTPAPNSAVDIIEQFNIADQGQAFSGFQAPADPAAARAAVSDVVEQRGVYIRRLKGAVMPTLPQRTFTRVPVRMYGAQRSLYDGLAASLRADLTCTSDATFARERNSFMARRSALLQACSSPNAVDPGFAGTPAKLLALDELLEEMIATRGEKVVLWSYFTASVDAVVRRYTRFNPVRIDGSVSSVVDRREAVRRFQDDDETMLFVANPAAAGAGLTLHRARYAVYESQSNQAAHYLQSLDRIHRRGQNRPVEYLFLLCDETLETAEYERLLRKETEAQKLLGDVVEPPITREAMLSELVGTAAVQGTCA